MKSPSTAILCLGIAFTLASASAPAWGLPASLEPSAPSTACVYLILKQTQALFPIVISDPQCYDLAAQIAADIRLQAAAVGAELLRPDPAVACDPFQVKVCVTFRSSSDGAKLQPWIEAQVATWLQLITGPSACPPFLDDHTVAALVGGDGVPPLLPPSCLTAKAIPDCKPAGVDFPKCKCTTRKAATRFATIPFMYKAAGRRNTTSLYCFTIATVPPSPPNSPCAKTTLLSKAEVWARYAQRRSLVAVGLQPADAAVMSYFAPSWGSKDTDTLKVSPLVWNEAQAEGAKVCLELDASMSLDKFCMFGEDTCWISFFDDSRSCCPLFSATLLA